MFKLLSTFIAIGVTLAGCATQLTDAGQQVRVITAEEKGGCRSLRLITTNQRTGPDKPGNAMKAALNEAAAAGANGFYVASSALDWAEGASVVGEAMQCR